MCPINAVLSAKARCDGPLRLMVASYIVPGLDKLRGLPNQLLQWTYSGAIRACCMITNHNCSWLKEKPKLLREPEVFKHSMATYPSKSRIGIKSRSRNRLSFRSFCGMLQDAPPSTETRHFETGCDDYLYGDLGCSWQQKRMPRRSWPHTVTS